MSGAANDRLAPLPHRLEGLLAPRLLGYSVLELVIILALIATVAAIVVPMAVKKIEDAKIARAIDDIRAIEKEIALYELEHQTVPDSLAEVGFDNRLDPWAGAYEYYPFKEKGWKGKARKDQFLVPLNSSYDLYSRGPDHETAKPLQNPKSWDDVVRANDGAFVGRAREF